MNKALALVVVLVSLGCAAGTSATARQGERFPAVPLGGAVESAVRPQEPAPAGVLRPGDRATITIRWILEEGYYLDEKTTSSLAFTAPAGLAVTPATVATSGRVIGVTEQTAAVTVAADVPPGVHRVEVDAIIYFCSLREQWCRRVVRRMDLPIRVSTDAKRGPQSLELELPVPLDDER